MSTSRRQPSETTLRLYSLPRRELQALCKQHGIPANKTNIAMADALGAFVNKPFESAKAKAPPGPNGLGIKKTTIMKDKVEKSTEIAESSLAAFILSGGVKPSPARLTKKLTVAERERDISYEQFIRTPLRRGVKRIENPLETLPENLKLPTQSQGATLQDNFGKVARDDPNIRAFSPRKPLGETRAVTSSVMDDTLVNPSSDPLSTPKTLPIIIVLDSTEGSTKVAKSRLDLWIGLKEEEATLALPLIGAQFDSEMHAQKDSRNKFNFADEVIDVQAIEGPEPKPEELLLVTCDDAHKGEKLRGAVEEALTYEATDFACDPHKNEAHIDLVPQHQEGTTPDDTVVKQQAGQISDSGTETRAVAPSSPKLADPEYDATNPLIAPLVRIENNLDATLAKAKSILDKLSLWRADVERKEAEVYLKSTFSTVMEDQECNIEVKVPVIVERDDAVSKVAEDYPESRFPTGMEDQESYVEVEVPVIVEAQKSTSKRVQALEVDRDLPSAKKPRVPVLGTPIPDKPLMVCRDSDVAATGANLRASKQQDLVEIMDASLISDKENQSERSSMEDMGSIRTHDHGKGKKKAIKNEALKDRSMNVVHHKINEPVLATIEEFAAQSDSQDTNLRKLRAAVKEKQLDTVKAPPGVRFRRGRTLVHHSQEVPS